MNVSAYKQWNARCREEYELLQFLKENYFPKALNDICFHGQQVIEKSLKSYLVLNDLSPMFRHDLADIAEYINRLEQRDVFTADDQKALAAISNYAVSARYPGGFACTEDDVNRVSHYCDEVINRIETMANAIISMANQQIKPPSKHKRNDHDRR